MKYKFVCVVGQQEESNCYKSEAKIFESIECFEAFEKAVKYGESFTRKNSFVKYSIYGIGEEVDSHLNIITVKKNNFVDVITKDYALKYIDILTNIDNESERSKFESPEYESIYKN